jgi:hypothetical protein
MAMIMVAARGGLLAVCGTSGRDRILQKPLDTTPEHGSGAYKV